MWQKKKKKNKCGESGHPGYVPDLSEKALNSSPLSTSHELCVQNRWEGTMAYSKGGMPGMLKF